MADTELAVWTSITRRLPRYWLARKFGGVLRRTYLRKHREPVQSAVGKFVMQLNPHENVDAALLFFPEAYDHVQREFIQRTLKPAGVFVDIGANIGLYTLVGSEVVGERGCVIAIEADPFNFEKLEQNLRLNRIRNVIACNKGVSDRSEVLRLGINTAGNRGNNSFLFEREESVPVVCLPLLDLLQSCQVERVDGLKIDIEGFEYRVLKPFLEQAPESLYPKFIVAEFTKAWEEKAGGNAIALLKQYGYVVDWNVRDDYILVHKKSVKTECQASPLQSCDRESPQVAGCRS